MADTKTIKNKLTAVGNIGKITGAMEMTARSKMKKAIDRALSVRPYAFFALEFLVNFSYHLAAVSPFFIENKSNRVLILEIAANKGLCGGYNSNLFRELKKFCAQNEGEFDFVVVGKYAKKHAKMLNGNIIHSFSFSEDISLSEVEELAKFVKNEYRSGKYAKILIVSTHFKSTLVQKPVVRQLLPLSPEVFKNQMAEAGGEENWVDIPAMHLKRDWSNYVVEPSEDEILNTVIPQMVIVQVYQAVADALASEQASRMMAMKSATEAAEKVKEELLLTYNHARQEGITRELSEIAAGANAI